MKFIRILILCSFLMQYSSLSETLFKAECGYTIGQIYYSKDKSLLVVPFQSDEGISRVEIHFNDDSVTVDRKNFIISDEILYFVCFDNNRIIYQNHKGEFHAIVEGNPELLRHVPEENILATPRLLYWIFSDEHSLYPNQAVNPKLKLSHVMNISPISGIEILSKRPSSKMILFPGIDFLYYLDPSNEDDIKVFMCERDKEREKSECLPIGVFPYGRAYMGASLEVNGKPALVWHDEETSALCLAYYDEVEMKWSDRHVILQLKDLGISESVFAGSFIVSEDQLVFCFNDNGEISGGALNLLTGKKRIWKIRSIAPNNYFSPFLIPTANSSKFIFGYYDTGDVPVRPYTFDEIELNIELIECDVGEWQDI